MLTIHNIERIVGMSANGNEITGFKVHNNMIVNGYHYVFVMKKPYKDAKVEVWLNRELKNGWYELFVMGWGTDTCVKLTRNDLSNTVDAAACIRKSLLLLEKL